MHITIAPCDVRSAGFARLVRHLDDEMNALYPAASNHLDSIEALAGGDAFVVGAFDIMQQVGCGAFKCMSDDGVYGEVKRLFVEPAYRGLGLSRRILAVLEEEMKLRGLAMARLEAGVAGIEAMTVYERAGYRRRGPFGAYGDDPNSVYFEKPLDLVC